jgi:hypothetical protein
MRVIVWEGKQKWLILPNKDESQEQAMETAKKLEQLGRWVDQLPDYEKAQIVAEARARGFLECAQTNKNKQRRATVRYFAPEEEPVMQHKRRYAPEEVAAALARALPLYNTRPNAVYEAALDYIQRGWALLPLPLAGEDSSVGKRPMLKGWQSLRFTTPEQVQQHFLNRVVNVGGILGEASNLIDIDLDCPQAISLANKYLPPTGSTFGRVSAPRSHWLYQRPGPAPSRSFYDPLDKESMIVELRADAQEGKSGKQTVLPGSLHVLSGEWIEWAEDGALACPAYVDLHRSVVQLATAVLLLRHCPGAATDEEIRHALAKADPLVSLRLEFWQQWQQEVEGKRPAPKQPAPKQSAPKRPSMFAGATVELPPADAALPPPTEHEVARVFTALTYTESSDRNEVWLPFGGALHDLSGWPEDLRYALWKWWSIHMDPAGKFDEADQEKTWESLGRDYKGKRATVGSIFKHAQKNGWDNHTVKLLPDEIKALVPPPVEVKATAAGDALMNAARRLARMPLADYMLERKKAAAEHAVTLADLDKLVRMVRKDESEPADRAAADAVAAAEAAADLEQQRRDLGLNEPEAWTEEVNGRALVQRLGATLLRYVVMSPVDALVTALWIMHTYVYDSFKCTPRLCITAPEPECGKTTLLDLVAQLVNRPYRNDLPTGPGLFRTIELGKPTTLIDEVELLFRAHGDAAERSNDLLSVLNLGHRRGGRIGRLMPWKKTYRMQHFDVFAPVAYAIRGDRLPPTLWSRSIRVRLERKFADDHVDDFDESHDEVLLPLQQLAREIRRWCDDNVEQIAAYRSERFKGIGNRFLNNWKPLLAIAHVAGWGEEAKDVLHLRAQEREIISGDTGILLLADCRRVRDAGSGEPQIKSTQLASDINRMEDREWGDHRNGTGVSPRWIAAVLSRYKIYAEQRALRFADGAEMRGYLWKSFELAWKRYLPPSQTSVAS